MLRRRGRAELDKNPADFYRLVNEWCRGLLSGHGYSKGRLPGYPRHATWVRSIDPAPSFPEPDRDVVSAQLVGESWSDTIGGKFRLLFEHGKILGVEDLLPESDLARMDQI